MYSSQARLGWFAILFLTVLIGADVRSQTPRSEQTPSSAGFQASDRKQVYWAGSLFTIHELSGNVALKGEVEKLSNAYRCVLPQSLILKQPTEQNIRNNDLAVLSSSDALVLWFEGTELDSGTVVEFVTAKFLDIPVVIVRTDPRREGREGEIDRHFNLMTKNWPRTETLTFNSIALYQGALEKLHPGPGLPSLTEEVEAQRLARIEIAKEIVQALNKVVSTAPQLTLAEKKDQLKRLPKIIGSEFASPVP